MCRCTSKNCNRMFSNEELKITRDKEKCILHSSKKIIDSEYRLNYFYKLLREEINSAIQFSTHIIVSDIVFPNHEFNDDKFNEFFKSIKKGIYFKNCSFFIEEFYSDIKCSFFRCDFYKNINFRKFEPLEIHINGSIFEYCDFQSIKIDELLYRKSVFTNSKISNLYLINSEIKDLFLDYPIFDKKEKFIGKSAYESTEVKNSLIINNCMIKSKIDLSNTNLKTLIVNNSTIKKEFYFFNNKNVNNISIKNCIFEDIIDLNSIKVQNEIKINNTKFNSLVFLNSLSSKNNLNLNYTIFQGLLDLKNAKLGGLNFDKVSLKGTNFLNIEVNDLTRETARIIKNSFEQQNNIIEANKFYALEMKKREDELKDDIKKGKNFFEYLVFLFHRLSSNHSQNWLLSLFWIFNFTIGYTLFSCYEFNNDLIFGVAIVTFSLFILAIAFLLNQYIDNKFTHASIMVVFSFISFFFYGFLMDDLNLYKFSNHINPFSIMTEFSDLTFLTLIYKVTIAYLIYQLIISIRQNTRRK